MHSNLLLFLLIKLMIFGSLYSGDVSRDFIKGYAAEVGSGKIKLDQVFELWAPVWYEVLTKVRNNKLSIADGNKKLQEEWGKSLESLIKEELFYQESIRENEQEINEIIDSVYRQASRNNSSKTREMIAKEIYAAVNKNMEQALRQLTRDYVRDSGGMLKLKQVLDDRGVSYHEWQDRLKRKAFSASYINTILPPSALQPTPKQIKEYYSAHPEEFSIPGAVKFRHIFIDKEKHNAEDSSAKEIAIDVWEMLQDGDIDFITAVRDYSDDKISKQRDGLEEGVNKDSSVERESWLSELRSAAKLEELNNISPILETNAGYHIVMLLEITKDEKIPFKEAQHLITNKLQSKAWDRAVEKLFESLKNKMPINVFVAEFPEELSCNRQENKKIKNHTIYRIGKVALPGIDND